MRRRFYRCDNEGEAEMWHHGDRFFEWVWRKVETAAIAAAVGWTLIWMSRLPEAVPISRARRLPRRRANRADVGSVAPEDRDGGAAWDRNRRRRLVDTVD